MALSVRKFACFGVGLGCVAAAQTAAARDLAGAVQLSLDGSLFSYSTVTKTPSSQPISDPNGGFGGFGGDVTVPTVTTTESNVAFMGSGLGFGVGYGVTDHALIGAQLQLAHTKEEDSDASQAFADVSLTTFSFLPRVEYVFGGDMVRPYVAGVVGVQSASGSQPSEPTSVSSTSYLYGGAVGLHAFVTDSFSFDPALTLLGQFGSFHADSVDYSTSGAAILLSVGLSAWLGPPKAPEAPKEEPAASTAADVQQDAPTEAQPPLAARIGLPGHREIDLQVARDPRLPSILVRVYEQESESELLSCRDIRVQASPTPVELNVTSVGNQPLGARARHFVVGVLPVHGLEALAQSDTKLLVCTSEWSLSDKSRAKIQDFLARRRALTGEAPPPAPAPPTPSAIPPPPETLFPPEPAPAPAVPPPATLPEPKPVAPPPAPVAPAPPPKPVAPAPVAPAPPTPKPAPPPAPVAPPPAAPVAPPAPPPKPKVPPSAAFPDAPPAAK